MMPSLCVFYDAGTGRAFKITRSDADSFRISEGSREEGVFVPNEDMFTGSWVLLPGQPIAGGQLEFRLDGPMAAALPRLTVHANNAVEFTAGRTTVRFRLRQYDPTHWATVSLPDSPTTPAMIALEKGAASLVGPNVLLTRWRLGGKTLTAVFRAEESQKVPRVPVVRFDSSEPLTVEALLPSVATPSK